MGAAETTRPSEPPAPGTRISVRFPLAMRTDLEDASTPVRLQAELYWGGRIQVVERRVIDEIYAQATQRSARAVANREP